MEEASTLIDFAKVVAGVRSAERDRKERDRGESGSFSSPVEAVAAEKTEVCPVNDVDVARTSRGTPREGARTRTRYQFATVISKLKVITTRIVNARRLLTNKIVHCDIMIYNEVMIAGGVGRHPRALSRGTTVTGRA